MRLTSDAELVRISKVGWILDPPRGNLACAKTKSIGLRLRRRPIVLKQSEKVECIQGTRGGS